LKHNNKKILNATKWSSVAEISSRLIAPLTNIILARLLVPEAFGIIATITLIITFFDLFVESGFHNYLIQNKFKSDADILKTANVAFWSNLFLSACFFILVVIFRFNITNLLNINGLENLLIVASTQLFINAFISVPSALLKRNLDFKSIFLVKIASVFVPLIITIPLAFLGFSYWSVVIGNLGMSLCTSILMNLRSSWSPSLSFDFNKLKEMYSFSFWTQLESIVIWMTIWIDTFIISYYLNSYYLGIYKTSMSLVNNLMAIVASSILPVLFSSLSRLQNDEKEFNIVLLKFQKIVSLIVVPMGIGLYVFQDLATNILLGNQWKDASQIIGLWGLSSAIVVSLGYFNSEVYRAKGRPKLSVVSQTIHLAILVPSLVAVGNQSFESLLYVRVLVRVLGTAIGLGFLHYFFEIKIKSIFLNVAPSFYTGAAMGLLGYLLILLNNNLFINLIFVVICSIFYLWLLSINISTKNEFEYVKKSFSFINVFRKKRYNDLN